jgi:hypothetical protein
MSDYLAKPFRREELAALLDVDPLRQSLDLPQQMIEAIAQLIQSTQIHTAVAKQASLQWPDPIAQRQTGWRQAQVHFTLIPRRALTLHKLQLLQALEQWSQRARIQARRSPSALTVGCSALFPAIPTTPA